MIKLTYELRFCKCGECCGYYKDQRQAVVNGRGISLAINNHSLHGLSVRGVDRRVEAECWARPHSGNINPHTIVNNDLGDCSAADPSLWP